MRPSTPQMPQRWRPVNTFCSPSQIRVGVWTHRRWHARSTLTTKPRGQGSGLGLPQVYGFVKQSGGHLKLYSKLEQGATVKIYLPRSLEQQPVGRPPCIYLTVTGGDTILLVDDDGCVRVTVASMLEELGSTVLAAENGAKARLSAGLPLIICCRGIWSFVGFFELGLPSRFARAKREGHQRQPAPCRAAGWAGVICRAPWIPPKRALLPVRTISR
jgi:hypothetical protein